MTSGKTAQTESPNLHAKENDNFLMEKIKFTGEKIGMYEKMCKAVAPRAAEGSHTVSNGLPTANAYFQTSKTIVGSSG